MNNINSVPNKLQPVLYGALIMTAVSVLPVISVVNLFCCAGILLGGFSGIYFLNRQISGSEYKISNTDAVMTGALSGVLSAVLVSGIGLLLMLFSKNNPFIEMNKLFQEFNLSFPPEVEKQMNSLSDEVSKYGFSPTFVIFDFVKNLVMYPLFGILGAFLGKSVFTKKTG